MNFTIDQLINFTAYHSTIKMKSVNVKSNTYIDPIKEINNRDHKFKIGDIVRTSKYINNSAKGYTNWSEEFLVIKKVKSTFAMQIYH